MVSHTQKNLARHFNTASLVECAILKDFNSLSTALVAALGNSFPVSSLGLMSGCCLLSILIVLYCSKLIVRMRNVKLIQVTSQVNVVSKQLFFLLATLYLVFLFYRNIFKFPKIYPTRMDFIFIGKHNKSYVHFILILQLHFLE